MGMFDYVHCDVPLPDGWVGKAMQTKDFGRTMAKITITESGRLVTDQRDWWRSDDPEPVDLQFHGVFRFYGCGATVKDWHEYLAKFTDGQLVGIEVDPASAIEAASAGETADAGSTEGESAAAESRDAHTSSAELYFSKGGVK